MWILAALLLAVVALILIRLRLRSRPSRALRAFAVALFLPFSIALFAVGIYLLSWFFVRSSPRETALFTGVRYVRSVTNAPRPVVLHLVFVDLDASGISFVVTPPADDKSGHVAALTTREFVQRSGVQLAINANFFQPFHSRSPWDYYPRSGNLVEVLGIASSSGRHYSQHSWNDATLYISQSNDAQIGSAATPVWNAISGDQWLLKDGDVVAVPDAFNAYARCGAALSSDRGKLILGLVDGKQPGYSEGLTLPVFAEVLRRNGGHNAINLDGGGSVTLVCAGPDGAPITLNSPIHTRIPSRQRPVAVHLGIRADRPD